MNTTILAQSPKNDGVFSSQPIIKFNSECIYNNRRYLHSLVDKEQIEKKISELGNFFKGGIK